MHAKKWVPGDVDRAPVRDHAVIDLSLGTDRGGDATEIVQIRVIAPGAQNCLERQPTDVLSPGAGDEQKTMRTTEYRAHQRWSEKITRLLRR